MPPATNRTEHATATTQEPGKSPRRIHVSCASRNGGGGNTDRAGVLSHRRKRRKQQQQTKNKQTQRQRYSDIYCPVFASKFARPIATTHFQRPQCARRKPKVDFPTARTTTHNTKINIFFEISTPPKTKRKYTRKKKTNTHTPAQHEDPPSVDLDIWGVVFCVSS
jgi:hypothetical protein